MNSGLNVNDPLVVAAFRSALIHQGIFVLLLLGVIALAWAGAHGRLAAGQARPGAVRGGTDTADAGEPTGRRLLRAGFGLLWVVDGLLQAQPAMAAGLPSQVAEPSAAGSPAWVQSLVTWGGTMWSYHPVQAAAAAVWVQLGIGVWLLVAKQGPWSRTAGLASVGWGLVVWVWGESFGGIFAPGVTWLFGAPGAVVFYCVAGALVALPWRAWSTPRLGRGVLAAMGVFFAGMAVVQAWPGQGFWQGTSHGRPSVLAAMTASMAQTPQPAFLSGWIRSFTAFDEVNGFAVNLSVVVALAVIGVGLVALPRYPRLLRVVIAVMVVVCLADWVLVQDLGVLGGLGTDPNSMIPMSLVVIGGYLALVRPAVAWAARTAVAAPAVAADGASPGPGWRERVRPGALQRAFAHAGARSVASFAAIGIIATGMVPAAAAQASATASPLLAQSLAGSLTPLDYLAKGFRLTDQNGRPVSLASLRGKVVLMTFLDPVCTSACPLIAQEFRAADQILGPASRHVELVAIAANPVFHSVADTLAFTRQEQLAGVPNWVFLTGTLPQLRQVWRSYGVATEIFPGGSMVGHTEVALVIGKSGHVRAEFEDDPGPGTTATKASFAALLAGAARRVLAAS